MMKKMLGFITFFVGVFGIVYIFREDIGRFLYKKFILEGVEISTLEPNEYYQAKDYKYVQLTNDFIIKDKQQLLNAYYTIVDNGNDEFTFMCDRDYIECLDDVAELSHNQSTLSNINSFVHPYNSFASIETEYDSLGKVIVKVNKVYTGEDIRRINNKIKILSLIMLVILLIKKKLLKKFTITSLIILSMTLIAVIKRLSIINQIWLMVHCLKDMVYVEVILMRWLYS